MECSTTVALLFAAAGSKRDTRASFSDDVSGVHLSTVHCLRLFVTVPRPVDTPLSGDSSLGGAQEAPKALAR